MDSNKCDYAAAAEILNQLTPSEDKIAEKDIREHHVTLQSLGIDFSIGTFRNYLRRLKAILGYDYLSPEEIEIAFNCFIKGLPVGDAKNRIINPSIPLPRPRR